MAFKKRYILAGLATALAAVFSQFPASWIAPLTGMNLPIKPGGTLWDGYLPAINAVPPIKFKTRLAGLVTETPLLEFGGNGNGLFVTGTADRDQISVLTLQGDAVFLGQIDGRLSNLTGAFDLAARNIRFDGDCTGVSGQVSTDILTQNEALWQWRGPPLSGPITCENNVLTTTLSGNIPGQLVEAVLKIIPDGTYQIRAVINTNTPEAGLVLPLYGFEAQGERYTMNEAGRWM